MAFPRPRGHVRMSKGGVVFFDRDNLVVDLSLEIMIQALVGAETLRGVTFAYTKRPVATGLRSLSGPVGYAPLQPVVVSRDSLGLRSIGTWTALFTPSQEVTYDTLGLVTSATRLFAALNCGEVTLAAGETIEVEWQIAMGEPA